MNRLLVNDSYPHLSLAPLIYAWNKICIKEGYTSLFDRDYSRRGLNFAAKTWCVLPWFKPGLGGLKTLNAALLAPITIILKNWIFQRYLCPHCASGRLHFHHIADIKGKQGDIPLALDIGVGANLQLPLLLVAKIYGWKLLAVKVDPVSAKISAILPTNNPNLIHFDWRRQYQAKIYHSIMVRKIAFTLPMWIHLFHAVRTARPKASQRKKSSILARNKN